MHLERKKEDCLVKELLELLNVPADWDIITESSSFFSKKKAAHKIENVEFVFYVDGTKLSYVTLKTPVSLEFRYWNHRSIRNKIIAIIQYYKDLETQEARQQAMLQLSSVVDFERCN